jgi:hypothetical protein
LNVGAGKYLDAGDMGVSGRSKESDAGQDPSEALA